MIGLNLTVGVPLIPKPMCYETGCPGCGYQFLFKKPLTDWTTIFCGTCNDYVRVR